MAPHLCYRKGRVGRKLRKGNLSLAQSELMAGLRAPQGRSFPAGSSGGRHPAGWKAGELPPTHTLPASPLKVVHCVWVWGVSPCGNPGGLPPQMEHSNTHRPHLCVPAPQQAGSEHPLLATPQFIPLCTDTWQAPMCQEGTNAVLHTGLSPWILGIKQLCWGLHRPWASFS